MIKSKYRIEKKKFAELNSKVFTPNYQRGVVWGKDQKEKYIETVKNGYPFGTFLIYEENMDKYSLVDGLQRFSTLKDYFQNPTKYLKLEVTLEIELNNFFAKVQEIHQNIYNDEIKRSLVKVLYNSFKEKIEYNYDFVKNVANSLKNEIPIFKDERYFDILNGFIFSSIEKLNSQISLDELDIPVIIFMGEKKDLPDIFAKMNSNGTQLSKYDIFAATWSTYENIIDDEEILEIVDQKYQEMLKNQVEIQIEGYEVGDIFDDKVINLFEYCFAIGQIIKKNCPALVSGNGNRSESLGFSFLSSLLGLHLQDMYKLPERIDMQKDSQFLVDLKNKVKSTAQYLNGVFIKHVEPADFNVNSRKNYYSKYIESQFITLMVTVFRIHFSIDFNEKIIKGSMDSKLWNNFKKFAVFHYFDEIITKKWAGSGDNTIESELKKDISKIRYVNTIDKIEFEQHISDWMKSQFDNFAEKIDVESKLFLNVIFKLMVPANRYSRTFDFEHIVSRKKLKNKALPVSSVGNLCIFPTKENRSKKDQTLYEYLDSREILSVNLEQKNDFLYPERDEIYFSQSILIDPEQYLSFLKDRNNYLINVFRKVVLEQL